MAEKTCKRSMKALAFGYSNHTELVHHSEETRRIISIKFASKRD
jgi:hypothetical protein